MAPAEPLAFVTVVAGNFRAFARVLTDSLHAWHPGARVYVVVADAEATGVDAAGSVCVLRLGDLGIPGLHRCCFAYNRQQLTVLAKPHALAAVLARGHQHAVFLDADIQVLGPLDPLLVTTAAHTVTLTPHLLEPPAGDDRMHRQLTILRSGVYNGGCVGVTASEEARWFLHWWAERLATHCLHAPDAGMHYDQRWLDLAPSLVDGLGIARDPGLNVAYWNVRERAPHRAAGRWVVRGDVCRFFHFSGFDPMRPEVVTRYWPQVGRDSMGEAAGLLDAYGTALLAAGHEAAQRVPYSFGFFDNGVPIPDVARTLFQGIPEAGDRFGNPFATQGESFYRWLTEPATSTGVPRLWQAIYDSRPDLQQAYPAPASTDRGALLQWARTFGIQEHAIDPALAPGP